MWLKKIEIPTPKRKIEEPNQPENRFDKKTTRGKGEIKFPRY
jgi:hypothetical protein